MYRDDRVLSADASGILTTVRENGQAGGPVSIAVGHNAQVTTGDTIINLSGAPDDLWDRVIERVAEMLAANAGSPLLQNTAARSND